MQKAQWWQIAVGGQEHGPFTTEQVIEALELGLARSTPLRPFGAGRWASFDSIPAFEGVRAKVKGGASAVLALLAKPQREQRWFVAQSEQVSGPHNAEAVREMIAERQLLPWGDMVCAEGSAVWVALEECEAFAEAVGAVGDDREHTMVLHGARPAAVAPARLGGEAQGAREQRAHVLELEEEDLESDERLGATDLYEDDEESATSTQVAVETGALQRERAEREDGGAALPKERRWYAARGKEIFGPFTLTKLRQAVEVGELRPTHLLCELGTQEWKPAGRQPELADLYPPPVPLARVEDSGAARAPAAPAGVGRAFEVPETRVHAAPAALASTAVPERESPRGPSAPAHTPPLGAPAPHSKEIAAPLHAVNAALTTPTAAARATPVSRDAMRAALDEIAQSIASPTLLPVSYPAAQRARDVVQGGGGEGGEALPRWARRVRVLPGSAAALGLGRRVWAWPRDTKLAAGISIALLAGFGGVYAATGDTRGAVPSVGAAASATTAPSALAVPTVPPAIASAGVLGPAAASPSAAEPGPPPTIPSGGRAFWADPSLVRVGANCPTSLWALIAGAPVPGGDEFERHANEVRRASIVAQLRATTYVVAVRGAEVGDYDFRRGAFPVRLTELAGCGGPANPSTPAPADEASISFGATSSAFVLPHRDRIEPLIRQVPCTNPLDVFLFRWRVNPTTQWLTVPESEAPTFRATHGGPLAMQIAFRIESARDDRLRSVLFANFSSGHYECYTRIGLGRLIIARPVAVQINDGDTVLLDTSPEPPPAPPESNVAVAPAPAPRPTAAPRPAAPRRRVDRDDPFEPGGEY